MYLGPAFQSAHTHSHDFYTQHASNLIGRQIRINRGGHDSVEGILVAIPSDYLVVLTDDGIVYVNGAHVKSITEGVHDSGGKSGGRSGGGRSGGGRSRGSHSRGSHSRGSHSRGSHSKGGRSRGFVSASSFQSLLRRLHHKHVQINRGGPEKLDGFLAEIGSDNVLLVVDRELVRIPTFHIKTVSISSDHNKNKKDNNKHKSGGNKNKSGKKSSNKHSGGGKGGRHK